MQLNCIKSPDTFKFFLPGLICSILIEGLLPQAMLLRKQSIPRGHRVFELTPPTDHWLKHVRSKGNQRTGTIV